MYKEKILLIVLPICLGLIIAFLKAIYTHFSQLSGIKNFLQNAGSGLLSSFENLDISYIPEDDAFSYFSRFRWLYATKSNVFIYENYIVVLVYRKFPLKLYVAPLIILKDAKIQNSITLYFSTFTVKNYKEYSIYKNKISVFLKSSASDDVEIHFNNIFQQEKNALQECLKGYLN